ncbi:hypothetical protein BDZ97DRAFT_1681027, partial [Flammula alnicola]
GAFRKEVNGVRQHQPAVGAVVLQNKRKETVAPTAAPSAKRNKVSEPGGLLPDWKRRVQGRPLKAQQTRQVEDDEEEQVVGEFDNEEGPEALAAVRAAKPSTVKIRTGPKQVGVGVKITERSVIRRPKSEKYSVNHLPFPRGHPTYLRDWRKSFRPTIISWASTFLDAYGPSAFMTDVVVFDIWDTIYTDLVLLEKERKETLYLIISLSTDILQDWRTSIGSTALTILGTYFTENFDTQEEIVEFVEWATDFNKVFNFIYASPDAPAGERQGFQSDLILDIYAVHIKKTAASVKSYGAQVGAMGLCTAAMERALSLWASGVNPAETLPEGKKLPAFGDNEWGPRARSWAQAATRLSAEDWEVINEEAFTRSNVQGKAGMDLEDSEVVDARSLIDIW